jgi:hypothetical protein
MLSFIAEINNPDCIVRKFIPAKDFEIRILLQDEIEILEKVINESGMLTSGEILSRLPEAE